LRSAPTGEGTGQGRLKAYTWYRLGENGEFVEDGGEHGKNQ